MKNLSGVFGYALVGVFIYVCVTKLTNNPELFVNSHGLLIVGGGLLVATFASFPVPLLKDAGLSVIRSLSPNGRVSSALAEEMVAATKSHHKGIAELERSAETIRHPFLKQAVNLVLEGIPVDTVIEILNKRIDEKGNGIQSQTNVLLTLSKYSPALGLAATVLGLVDLLGQLASADMGKLGYGMAVALSATFYGVILSNLVFAPLSEMIMSSGDVEIQEMEMVRDGIDGMMRKQNHLVVGEMVNSYLTEERRIDFTQNVKTSEAA